MKCNRKERNGVLGIVVDLGGKGHGLGRKICNNAWFANVHVQRHLSALSADPCCALLTKAGFWACFLFEFARDSV